MRRRTCWLAFVAIVAVGAATGCSAPQSSSSASPPSPPGGSAPATTSPARSSPSSAPARFEPGLEAATVHRSVREGELAAFHSVQPGVGRNGADVVAVDVYRLAPDGQIAERTTVKQDVPATPSANGHTMFDGGGQPHGTGDAAANKAIVQRLYDDVFNGTKSEVIDTLMATDYVQHNPALPDGSAAFKGLVANGLPVTVKQLVAEDDLVFALVEYGGSVPAVDIFRLADGKIVEHWDVLQR